MFQEVLGRATMMAGTWPLFVSQLHYYGCGEARHFRLPLGGATVVTRHAALLESDGGTLRTATGWPTIVAKGVVLQAPAQWGYYSCWEGGEVLQNGLLLVGVTMAEGKHGALVCPWQSVGHFGEPPNGATMDAVGGCALCPTSAMLLGPSSGT